MNFNQILNKETQGNLHPSHTTENHASIHHPLIGVSMMNKVEIESTLETANYVFQWLMSFWPTRMMIQLSYSLFSLLFVAPLFKLYISGPSLGGHGFWGGKSYAEICHHLTQIDVNFWTTSEQSIQKCEELVMKQWSIFLTGCTTLLYIWVMLLILRNTFYFFASMIKDLLRNIFAYRELNELDLKRRSPQRISWNHPSSGYSSNYYHRRLNLSTPHGSNSSNKDPLRSSSKSIRYSNQYQDFTASSQRHLINLSHKSSSPGHRRAFSQGSDPYNI